MGRTLGATHFGAGLNSKLCKLYITTTTLTVEKSSSFSSSLPNTPDSCVGLITAAGRTNGCWTFLVPSMFPERYFNFSIYLDFFSFVFFPRHFQNTVWAEKIWMLNRSLEPLNHLSLDKNICTTWVQTKQTELYSTIVNMHAALISLYGSNITSSVRCQWSQQGKAAQS